MATYPSYNPDYESERYEQAEAQAWRRQHGVTDAEYEAYLDADEEQREQMRAGL